MPRTPIRFEELPKGLMSYHGNFLVESTCRDQVDKLLKGANLAELPVLQPTEGQSVIKLKTMKPLGISIPQSVLLRADEVIQ